MAVIFLIHALKIIAAVRGGLVSAGICQVGIQDNHIRLAFIHLIFSYDPAAFEEQTTFTLKQYCGQVWESLQRKKHTSYSDPIREAQTAEESEHE